MNALFLLAFAVDAGKSCGGFDNQLNAIDYNDANRIVNFAFSLNEQFPSIVETCDMFKSLLELSRFLVSLPGRIEDVPLLLTHTVQYLGSAGRIESLLSNSSEGKYLQLLSLVRLTSSHVRRLANNKGLFQTSCAVSYRFRSSTLLSLESQWASYLNSTHVFPISSRVRDISITRDRCREDSTLSVLSILRSVKQISRVEELSELYSYLSDSLRSIGILRLFGVKQPLWELVFAVALTPCSQSAKILRYVSPLKRKVGSSNSPVFGFDCEREPKKNCEVEAVISAFSSSYALGEFKYRKEFQFLQSVNANWLPYLHSGYGKRITASLIELAKGPTVVHSQPSIRCKEDELKSFLDNSYEEKSLGSRLVLSLRTLMTLPTDCSISLSAANAIIMDALVEVFVRDEFPIEIYREDVGELLEISWQTVAGEKFHDLLSSPVPLFTLMDRTWSRLPLFT